jgi:KUP system potassium uptake protein
MIWRKRLFATMMRNSQSPMSHFRLPVNKAIELGGQVEI